MVHHGWQVTAQALAASTPVSQIDHDCPVGVAEVATGAALCARDWVTRYRNVTVATARLTLSCGQTVTGPGAEPGVAILVPWPGCLRICSPAAFDTLTAPSIRNTPSA